METLLHPKSPIGVLRVTSINGGPILTVSMLDAADIGPRRE